MCHIDIWKRENYNIYSKTTSRKNIEISYLNIYCLVQDSPLHVGCGCLDTSLRPWHQHRHQQFGYAPLWVVDLWKNTYPCSTSTQRESLRSHNGASWSSLSSGPCTTSLLSPWELTACKWFLKGTKSNYDMTDCPMAWAVKAIYHGVIDLQHYLVGTEIFPGWTLERNNA